MKKRILLIALLGIFMGFCWSCSKEDGEQAKTPSQESKQSTQGTGIEIDFDTLTETDTIDLD